MPCNKFTDDPGPNVAVARVEGYDKLIYGFSKGNGYHAEDHIMDQIDALRERGFDIGGITALYSERQPCPICETKLPAYMATHATITYSVLWSGNGLKNSVSQEMLARAIRIANGGIG